MFFKRTKLNTEGLVARHKELKLKKSGLEATAAQLKRDALYGDIEDLGARLSEARLQIELCDAGLLEVEGQLRQHLTERIEADYAALPGRRAQYEAALAENFSETGRTLAKAVHLLGLSSKGPLSGIAKEVQRVLERVAERDERGEYSELIDSYNAFAPDVEFLNLADERRQMATIEARRPGSPEAANHVNYHVQRLLEGE